MGEEDTSGMGVSVAVDSVNTSAESRTVSGAEGVGGGERAGGGGIHFMHSRSCTAIGPRVPPVCGLVCVSSTKSEVGGPNRPL